MWRTTNVKANKGYKQAIGKLRKQMKDKPESRPEFVTELWMSEIELCEPVFQPRSLIGNYDIDKQHVAELKAQLRMLGGDPLDPLTVWWSGKRWYVIDGHHRLKAYRATGGIWDNQRKIPVLEFKGTLDEAVSFTVKENAKVRLAMSKQDRLNAAWRMVCTTKKSKAQITKETGVSNGTLGNMRRALEVLLGNPRFLDADECAGLTWAEAFKEWRGDWRGSGDEDGRSKLEKTAEAWMKRLEKHVGTMISKNPEAFALALAMLNAELPIKLMETDAWKSYNDYLEEELKLEEEVMSSA